MKLILQEPNQQRIGEHVVNVPVPRSQEQIDEEFTVMLLERVPERIVEQKEKIDKMSKVIFSEHVSEYIVEQTELVPVSQITEETVHSVSASRANSSVFRGRNHRRSRSSSGEGNDRGREACFTRPSADSHRGANRGRVSFADSRTKSRGLQEDQARARATAHSGEEHEHGPLRWVEREDQLSDWGWSCEGWSCRSRRSLDIQRSRSKS